MNHSTSHNSQGMRPTQVTLPLHAYARPSNLINLFTQPGLTVIILPLKHVQAGWDLQLSITPLWYTADVLVQLAQEPVL